MMKASDSVRMSNASTIYVQVSCHEAVIQAVTAVIAAAPAVSAVQDEVAPAVEPEPAAEPLNEKFVSVYPYSSEEPGDLIFEAGEVNLSTLVWLSITEIFLRKSL